MIGDCMSFINRQNVFRIQNSYGKHCPKFPPFGLERFQIAAERNPEEITIYKFVSKFSTIRD